MIKAFVFDLDGTLVQTELLKAKSYARAVSELSEVNISEAAVFEAFKEVVGLSRKEVTQKLMDHFELKEAASSRMEEFRVQTPWQALVQVRMKYYNDMFDDPGLLKEYSCPYNLALLEFARIKQFSTGLATMSHCDKASKVLEILDIRDKLDFVATRDDVENGKPDPEIYLLIAEQLSLSPEQCLVIEDSTAGVEAALAAGMGCIAVTTDFTHDRVRESGLLEERWITGHSPDLQKVVEKYLSEKNN